MAKKDLKKGKKDSKKGGAKGKKAAAKAAPPKQRAKAAPEVIEPLLMDVGAAGGAATAVAAPADDGTVDDSGPKAQEIATFLGVELSKFLTTDQIQKLRRGLPGYTNVLDDASVQLKKDEKQLALSDITPDKLMQTKADQKFLSVREVATAKVQRSVYEQRLQKDDEGMGMLQKIARRVVALSEDDPDLLERWKFLLDFLGEFRGGGRPKKAKKAKGAPTP